MNRKIIISSLICLVVAAGADAAKPRKQRSMSAVKKEQQATAENIKRTAEELAENKRRTARTLGSLNVLEAEIREHGDNIGRIKAEIAALDRRSKALADSIALTEAHLGRLQQSYAASVKRMQRSSGQNNMSKLAFVFSSESFTQAYRRMRYLREFAQWRGRKHEELTQVQAELTERRKKFDALKASKQSAMKKLDAERNTLQGKQRDTQRLVEELQQQKSALAEVLSEEEARSRALDEELDRLIAEEQRRQEEERRIAEEKRLAEERRIAEEKRKAEELRLAQERERIEKEKAAAEAAKAEEARKAAEANAGDKAKKQQADKNRKKQEEKARREREKQEKKAEQERKKREKQKKTAPKPAAPEPAAPTTPQPAPAPKAAEAPLIDISGSFESNKGRLPFPVVGKYRIVKPFGRHQHPSLPHVTTENGGIDVESLSGGQARAIFDGKVSAIFRQPGYNTIVMVRHGRYLTIYANLADINVKNGDTVKAGQSIGRIFADPENDSRAILHFELRREKEKLNPSLWVK